MSILIKTLVGKKRLYVNIKKYELYIAQYKTNGYLSKKAYNWLRCKKSQPIND